MGSAGCVSATWSSDVVFVPVLLALLATDAASSSSDSGFDRRRRFAPGRGNSMIMELGWLASVEGVLLRGAQVLELLPIQPEASKKFGDRGLQLFCGTQEWLRGWRKYGGPEASRVNPVSPGQFSDKVRYRGDGNEVPPRHSPLVTLGCSASFQDVIAPRWREVPRIVSLSRRRGVLVTLYLLQSTAIYSPHFSIYRPLLLSQSSHCSSTLGRRRATLVSPCDDSSVAGHRSPSSSR